ncbi:hypothetical protein [Pseudonocardia sp. HH130630-07]|uniref:hypothetical protein n=1 Tax=Pseudonocardia sp. HH130630-07 TaxID=1690815 RepID=UPI000814D7BD|nr:hypothetical protein [Pseudonocardia sp. HH130630-07]ANY05595.1 hypothetical protein AFB00_03915 [Pseudonocardia sp. HH130630-07]
MVDSHDGAARPAPSGRRATSKPSAAVLTPPTGLPAVEPSAEPRVPVQVPAQRAPADPIVPASTGVRLCACGHPEDVHEHYRPGSDCGACGARACDSFRALGEPEPSRNPLRRLLRR